MDLIKNVCVKVHKDGDIHLPKWIQEKFNLKKNELIFIDIHK